MTCAPRMSNSVDLDCRLGGVPVPCSRRLLDGTKVTMKCKDSFRLKVSSPRVITCKEGTWDHNYLDCEPGLLASPPRTPVRSKNALSCCPSVRRETHEHHRRFRHQRQKHHYQRPPLARRHLQGSRRNHHTHLRGEHYQPQVHPIR